MGFSVQPCVFVKVYMELLKKSDWQPWVWPLFTNHWLEYSESSFTNVRNDFSIYLTIVVTNCSGEQPFSKLMAVD